MSEIDLDLSENAWVTYLALALIIALALMGLALIGQNATPDGQAKVLAWSDWQVLQARRAHNSELVVLRQDLNEIALRVQKLPDPISAQILQTRISRHTSDGQPTLELARASLQNAADGLAAWSAGQIERETLIELIQTTELFLK
jgi:hypothetical protein